MKTNYRTLTLRLDKDESKVLTKLMEVAQTKVASTALMYAADNCTRFKKQYEETQVKLNSLETKHQELEARVKMFNAAFKELAEISQAKGLQTKIR